MDIRELGFTSLIQCSGILVCWIDSGVSLSMVPHQMIWNGSIDRARRPALTSVML